MIHKLQQNIATFPQLLEYFTFRPPPPWVKNWIHGTDQNEHEKEYYLVIAAQENIATLVTSLQNNGDHYASSITAKCRFHLVQCKEIQVVGLRIGVQRATRLHGAQGQKQFHSAQ